MASIAPAPSAVGGDDRFFLISALLMALLMIVGFSVHLGMGRSNFDAPFVVHAHAVAFMGWVGLYLAQTVFATIGPLAWHRRLGWVAAAWLAPMLVLGPAVTVTRVREGRVPFFFEPQHFLVANPVSMLAFVGLTIAAVAMRRRTDWHRRLHLCGMATLLGPGLGRLLPMPLLQPFAFQIAFLVGLLFPVAGMIVDRRRRGTVHPAWWSALAAIFAVLLAAELIARSPLGDAIYRAVTVGTPGAAVAPWAFAPPPGP